GGIFADVDSISIIIENNIIRNNTTDANTGTTGGGISIWNTNYARIVNNKIIDNTATCSSRAWGGGINCNGASNEVYIISNYIKGNIVNSNRGGGGICIASGTPVVKNNLIVGNSAYGGGGVLLEFLANTSSPSGNDNQRRNSLHNNGLNSNQILSKVTQSETLLENNTIFGNSATSGGGVHSVGYTPEIMNCIVWGNSAPFDLQITGNADVQYSDVQGGYTGTGNIDVNPEFDPTSDYYALLSSSQCVDAGNPDAIYNDVEDPNNLGNPMLPALGTLTNDMGHCGGPASTWIFWNWPMPVESSSPGVTEFTLMHNYPNPFNPSTIIKYDIRERTNVELKVFDILGREVISLVNEEQPVGSYEVEFNAANLSSGVYFYKLQAGSFVETKKMLFMK
ncbi:MAG: T9SS type A sorting domain-containing protein, partial [Ignavibacteriaceae bacterium]